MRYENEKKWVMKNNNKYVIPLYLSILKSPTNFTDLHTGDRRGVLECSTFAVYKQRRNDKITYCKFQYIYFISFKAFKNTIDGVLLILLPKI